MIFVGRRSLDWTNKEPVEHYHDERCHQGIGNKLASDADPQRIGPVTASFLLLDTTRCPLARVYGAPA